MNSFTIRDVENLCGIKAHTLRVWEQRYNLLCPKRKAGNHRLYDNDDLKYLLRIAYLYHNGHKISAIARLSEQEICEQALTISPITGAEGVFINQLTEASLDFDQDRFDRILHNIILHLGFEKCIVQVAYPFLKKMGLLWLTGNVIPAQEHFASALITKKIYVAINGLDMPIEPVNPAKTVLLFAPKGEFNEIPLLYMRYLLKKNGVHTVYYGKDTTLDELKYYCSHKQVSHLYFHLVTNLLRCDPAQYVEKLSRLFPDKQLVISGCLAQSLNGNYSNMLVLKTLEAMQAFAGEK
jgi:DNA-binding transcriptional MerR regulator